ncbi:MarR family winged helix-turn-helix transcriptional regulator [Streptomyces cocklensis]|jgi:DNA-binding MarR family transcriptional regulator|uniref:DNA-binding transcriptional regulator, MarR family n=1 Tax=Actinacidiphila cocklensis TaxID=887465 RepID=A0A9W4E090_9ACTN|nr:MarR family winged helix-turn-helix transcriptional regulator [Actinacidiphila cocklensis]MDD1063370.1 MarR family winged helix-turn-helix transcriptional regulator [Actinacidiphila cocklensis]WSX74870.1 MarR family winged helix-turn-helix transcriptional regulator [Streptomyces sp. NBC_00899]CAG6399084.1 DNA-binding transcriptional regulator, MarR family [Actinacidiphila cocklensis]
MTTQEGVQPMSAAEEAFVRALSRVLQVLPRAVDQDMTRAGQLPLSEYMALVHLSEAQDRLMRMSELAAACDLSLSGMTRIVARLEQRGLVQRVRCEADGRGANAVLTEAGLQHLREAWPAHLASVRRHLLDHVEGEHLETLTQVLQRMVTAY